MLAYKVFISHCTADSVRVEQLRALFSAAGIQAYVCSNDVQPGRQLSEKLQREIQSSNAVLVIYTSAASSSAYVQQEIGFALRCKKLVVPFVDEASADNVDLAMLAGIEQVRFDPADPLPAITKLLERFKKERLEQQVWATVLLALMAAGLFYVAAQA